MPHVRTNSETTESLLYWNMLKDLSEPIKIQLIVKLKNSLLDGKQDAADADAQAAYYDILDKLNTYKNYQRGWDGENASPLTSEVVSNFSSVLEVIDKRLLLGVTIYPETNGTLLVDCNRREAGISLGNDRFSYYITDNDKVEGKNGIPFSVMAFTEVLKIINSQHDE